MPRRTSAWSSGTRRVRTSGPTLSASRAAETAEPNLGHIVENLRIQWALHESPYLRGVTEVRSGLAELECDEDSARVVLEDGRRLSCQLVIGADGGQSVARKLAGIGRAGWAYGQTAIVAHLQSAQPHRETAWQRFLPSGPLALLPLKDGRVSLVWSTSPEQAEALLQCGEAEFNERVSEASDHVLGDATLASARAGFPLALWHAREYVRPRLALVGDAAHTIHPLAGQGVNLGFLDCAGLVQVLADAADKGEEAHGMRVLRRYERWRRSENALVLALCDTLNRLFAERSVAVSAVRRLGMSIVTQQPMLRRSLIERALGLGGDVPALGLRDTLAGTVMSIPKPDTSGTHYGTEGWQDSLFTQAPPVLGNQFVDDPLLDSWLRASPGGVAARGRVA